MVDVNLILAAFCVITWLCCWVAVRRAEGCRRREVERIRWLYSLLVGAAPGPASMMDPVGERGTLDEGHEPAVHAANAIRNLRMSFQAAAEVQNSSSDRYGRFRALVVVLASGATPKQADWDQVMMESFPDEQVALERILNLHGELRTEREGREISLEARGEMLEKWHAEMYVRAEAQAKLAAVRAALKELTAAVSGDVLDESLPDDQPICKLSKITMGHLRRARAALAAAGPV